MRLLTPSAILTRLGRHMDLLRGGPVDAPRRHQTLREAVAWSYDLLSHEAQRLFQRFATFEAGASLDAVEVVAAATPRPVRDVLGEP
jgi:predicted ATPase